MAVSAWKYAQKMPYIICHQGNEQIKQQWNTLQHIYGSKDVVQQEPSVITGRDARGAAASHKTMHILTTQSSISLLGIYPKE